MKSDVARDSINTVNASIICAVMALIASVCITKVLIPAEKGLISETQMIAATLITFLSLSLNSAVIYFVAKFGYQSVKKTLNKLTFIITFVIIIIGIIGAFALKDNYFKGTALYI